MLPYPVGQQHKVIQDNCTDNTHQGTSRYAYDFAMDLGSPVTAAREGFVTWVKDRYPDFNGNGEGVNMISITHSDGTKMNYLHLRKGSMRVSVDDFVEAGDVIASSGASGLDSDGQPHLHILLKDAASGEPLPLTFSNTSPNPDGLKQKEWYAAFPY